MGLGVLVLLFVGFGPLGGGTPGENASGATVAAWYNAHVSAQWASIYVVGAGLALLIFYVSQLHGVLRDAEGGRTFLPNAVFAAGVILVTGVVVVGAFHIALILAAHNHEFAIAKTLNFVDSNDYLGLQFGVVLLTLSIGAAILSRSALPKWIGWVSVVIGVVAALGPIGWFGILAFAVWLPILGFVIAAKAKVPPSDSPRNLPDRVSAAS